MVGTTFSSRLKISRKAAGLTLDALAKKVGCTKGLLSQYESGAVKLPRADIAFGLADALEVSARWLTLGSGTQTQVKGIVDDEAYLLLVYRALPTELKDHLGRVAQSLADASATAPTRASPLIGAPYPPKVHKR